MLEFAETSTVERGDPRSRQQSLDPLEVAKKQRAMRLGAPLVLVAQDDDTTRGQLAATLFEEGLRVVDTQTGAPVVVQAAAHNPDVIILDLGVSDVGETQVVTRLRELTTAPIMILADRAREVDRISALDAGANEFLNRRVGTRELLARLRVWMRHLRRAPGGSMTTVLEVGDLRVDFALSKSWVAGREVRLSPMEFKLFAMMMRNASRILTHEELLLRVWGSAYRSEPQYLRVYMRQLRQKFEVDAARPRYFLTERGIGYRLHAPS
jgi:two-component system, OmpR family, KDP operon response regulator KdpE